MTPETAAAEAAADAAGAVIRQYFRSRFDVETKHDNSPVTRADKGAETAIRDVLRAYFPDHAIIGEELGGIAAGRFVWMIDPIDGTRAFITGRPIFTTLIALLDHGVPVLGLIDQPISRERWLASNGTLRFNGSGHTSVVRTRHIETLAEAELSCTSPDMFDAPRQQRFRNLAALCRRTTYGGDAYAYGLLALGFIDVIAEADMKPWDWAALIPIIEAAGGKITDWQGSPLKSGGDGSVLALGNPLLLGSAVAALTPME